jgi:hypothetical protein
VNTAISPPVVVSVTDAFGNATDATVHMALNDPAFSTATLGGTVDVASSGGSATFSDLTVNQSSIFAYTLTASSPGLSSDTSSGFLVNP